MTEIKAKAVILKNAQGEYLAAWPGPSDSEPTENSENYIISGGVKKAIDQKAEECKTYIQNFQSPITALTATSGTIALAVNKIYTLSISSATTFSLPTPSNKNVFNQIKVILKVTGTPTVNWGTTQFFNKETPDISAGNYDVYFDYDNNLSAWVCGAMSKGVA